MVSNSGTKFGNDDDIVKPPAEADAADKTGKAPTSMAATWKERMMRGVEYDIHSKAEEDPLVAAIHANAEKWDPDTEFVFGFLQVAHSPCCLRVAHC